MGILQARVPESVAISSSRDYIAFAPVITDTDKSLALQGELEIWRLRRVSSVVLVGRMTGLRPKKGQCCSLSPKAEKSHCPSSKPAGQEEFSLT